MPRTPYLWFRPPTPCRINRSTNPVGSGEIRRRRRPVGRAKPLNWESHERSQPTGCFAESEMPLVSIQPSDAVRDCSSGQHDSFDGLCTWLDGRFCSASIHVRRRFLRDGVGNMASSRTRERCWCRTHCTGMHAARKPSRCAMDWKAYFPLDRKRLGLRHGCGYLRSVRLPQSAVCKCSEFHQHNRQ